MTQTLSRTFNLLRIKLSGVQWEVSTNWTAVCVMFSSLLIAYNREVLVLRATSSVNKTSRIGREAKELFPDNSKIQITFKFKNFS